MGLPRGWTVPEPLHSHHTCLHVPGPLYVFSSDAALCPAGSAAAPSRSSWAPSHSPSPASEVGSKEACALVTMAAFISGTVLLTKTCNVPLAATTMNLWKQLHWVWCGMRGEDSYPSRMSSVNVSRMSCRSEDTKWFWIRIRIPSRGWSRRNPACADFQNQQNHIAVLLLLLLLYILIFLLLLE